MAMEDRQVDDLRDNIRDILSTVNETNVRVAKLEQWAEGHNKVEDRVDRIEQDAIKTKIDQAQIKTKVAIWGSIAVLLITVTMTTLLKG
jgi:hypothetical protein